MYVRKARLTKVAVATAVAAAGALSAAGPVQAAAVGGSRYCSLSSASAHASATTQTGEVQSGTISDYEVTGRVTTGAWVTVHCSVKVGWHQGYNNGVSAASASNIGGINASSVPPTVVTYQVGEWDPVFICTEVRVNGVSYWWDAQNAVWLLSNGTACEQAFTVEGL